MEGPKQENRSVRETKRRLYTALIALMHQKPLQEITVRELTTQAGVSRGTFYFHYSDLRELMQELEQQHLDHLQALVEQLMPQLAANEVPPALLALLMYLQENADICRALYGVYGDPDFAQKVKRFLANQCLGHMAPDGGTPRQKLLTTFAVEGCFGTILAWQELGYYPPAEETARTAWQAIREVERLI